MSDQQPVSFLVLGCGGRGRNFMSWCERNPKLGRVVAIAEPDAARRETLATIHGIPPERQFESWETALAVPKLADAVINTLMDRLHHASSLAALKLGYHMLLEKPMATSLEECMAIEGAARASGKHVAVCHSSRYSPVYSETKRILDSGAIGRLISFDQLEGVDPIHQSHSFVRGNWGNSERSTFMLLAKSCHDIDVFAWLVGRRCRKVSSFGALTFFRPESAPPGAGLRCTSCRIERDCMYSALKIYHSPATHWYAGHAGLAKQPSEYVLQQLETGPYGKCVWHTDNDVVDHQVVNFLFDDDVTGTFTMTAFAPHGRRLRLNGTLGYLTTNTEDLRIDVVRFADGATTSVAIPPRAGSHGGSDDVLMRNFVDSILQNDPSLILTDATESLASHRIVFAAETSRLSGEMIDLEAFAAGVRR
jgi:predicted dehydrogenase